MAVERGAYTKQAGLHQDECESTLHAQSQIRTKLHSDSIVVAGVYPGPIDTRMTEQFEMEKAPASQVADRTLDSLRKGELAIFPDSFAEQMYAAFLNSPKELEKIFAEMHS